MKKKKFFLKYNLPIRSRIISGIILYIYAVTHLMNHALGLISLEVLEQGRLVFLAFWRFPGIEWVVPLALIVHLIFAAQAFFVKSSLRSFTKYQWIQYVTGFLVPLILIIHFISTRVMHDVFHVDDNYRVFLWPYVQNPLEGLGLFLLLVLTMIHGSLGIYYYLYLKSWFLKFKQGFIIFSVILPLLAIGGMIAAIKEIHFREQLTPGWIQSLLVEANPLGIDIEEQENVMGRSEVADYLVLVLLVFLGRLIYLMIKDRQRTIQVRYSDGQSSKIYKGASILDASNYAQIPHAQICHAHGRCSTCRVLVYDGEENLPPPDNDEQKVLNKIKAPPHVRLACQAKPIGNIDVNLLFPPDINVIEGIKRQKQFLGKEKELVILFADIRGFTAFSENRFPYDVVSILNQYFKATGTVIEQNHGYLDKFIGDGTMAIFGIDDGLKAGCRNAIKTAQQMSLEVEKINDLFRNDLETPIQIGIGIHCGKAIIGELGYKHTLHLTAIGDTVNTASRLESYTKDYQCQMIISDPVAENSGYDFSRFPSHDLEVRGRKQSLHIWSISKLQDITI